MQFLQACLQHRRCTVHRYASGQQAQDNRVHWQGAMLLSIFAGGLNVGAGFNQVADNMQMTGFAGMEKCSVTVLIYWVSLEAALVLERR
jgi:hypothetical protein